MRNHTPVLLLAALSVSGVEGHAQEAEPTVIRGPLSLDASLGVMLGHDDNVFKSATDERSSWVSRIAPEVSLSLSPSSHEFSLEYSGEYSWYNQAESADYRDHALQGVAAIPFLRRGQLELSIGRLDQHEDVGAGLTEGLPVELLPDEADRFSSTVYAARAAYGKSDSTLRVALELGSQSRSYKNNLARTRDFDREERYAAGQVGFRVSPDASLVLDLTTRDVEYDRAQPQVGSRDSREYGYMVGVEWQVSDTTSGSVSGGYLRKQFDDSAFSGPVWAVAVNWSPRDGSRFEFGSERTAEETTSLTASAIDTMSYSVGWRQDWRERLTSRVVVSSTDRDFVDGNGDRQEDLLQVGIELIYEARSWLIWDLGVYRDSENSTIRRSEYDRRLINLGATVRF